MRINIAGCINRQKSRNTTFTFALISILILTGCSPLFDNSPTETSSSPTIEPTPTSLPVSEAVVTFNVSIPQSTNQSTSIYIDILDEVTGLALNPARYRMDAIDPQHFSIQLPIKLGEIVKYRYVRGGDIPAIEYTSAGKQVRYRLLNVSAPMVVDDIVSGWIDQRYSNPSGRITGTVIDVTNQSPIANVLVCAGGLQTLTSSDGSFVLEGLPPGVNNLVAMTVDGSFTIFQQGANIVAGSSTPAVIQMTPTKMVSITFTVTIPPEILGVPVRLAGDLYSLGNTFSDLSGGVSVIASRMPVMTPLPDGRQSITLILPAGTDLHYKYSLGDGFWNSEHTQQGNFVVRDVIIPDHDTTFNDTVATWTSGQEPPITFNLTVPENTPPGDNVSIQFNPYGWTEPVPMWSVGKNQWMYVLFSPYNLVKNFSYRYCRNDQCGVADDSATQGQTAKGWQVTVGDIPQTFNDVVHQWSGLDLQPETTMNLAETITPRDNSFIAGVEFTPEYQPSWQSRYLADFQTLHQDGDRWVFFNTDLDQHQ